MTPVYFSHQAICPTKILCVGRNYAEHARELGNPLPEELVLFCKPNSSISDSLLSFHKETLHYELELCFMVHDRNFSAMGLGIDLTRRQLQSQLKSAGLPWERAKAFNGAATFSRFVPISADIETLHFDLHIDGELRQHGYVGDMIYSPKQILDELNSFMHLEDGDIVMSGTPKGVGEIIKGALFSARLFQANICLLEHSWIAQ